MQAGSVSLWTYRLYMQRPLYLPWQARLLAPLLLLLAAFTAAPVGAAGQVQIQDYGVYDLSVDGTVPAPEDVSGSRNIVSNIRLQRQTAEIDAQLGRFRITDPSLVGKTLTLRTTFPPLTNPESKRRMSTQDRTFVVTGTGDLLYDGYRFDYDWEMAEGTWTFQVLDGARVIAEQKFKVIVPMF
jgi:hypothetical protein